MLVTHPFLRLGFLLFLLLGLIFHTLKLARNSTRNRVADTPSVRGGCAAQSEQLHQSGVYHEQLPGYPTRTYHSPQRRKYVGRQLALLLAYPCSAVHTRYRSVMQPPYCLHTHRWRGAGVVFVGRSTGESGEAHGRNVGKVRDG